jgi:hypothetical protein
MKNLHRLATLLLRNTKPTQGECWHTRVTIEYKDGQPPRTFHFTAKQLKAAEQKA